MTPDNLKYDDQDDFEFLIRASLKQREKRKIEKLIAARKKRRVVRLVMGVAASFVIFIGISLGYTHLSKGSPQELAWQYLEEVYLPLPSNYRSIDKDSTTDFLQGAYDAIAEKNAQEAISIFSVYEETHELTNVEKLHYAYCIMRIEKEELQKSKELLTSIENAESGVEISTLYLLGLNEVLLGNEAKAIQCFNRLLDISSYQKDNVNIILKKINDENKE